MASNKRKSFALYDDGSMYDEPEEQPIKRAKKEKPKQQPRVDPTYGQTSAFPGLDSYSAYQAEEDDLEYEDDIEALQYLQAVR